MSLTVDLTRLRDEIGTLRKDRGTFVNELRIRVADLRASFFAPRMEMARKMKADLLDFVSDLKQGVAERRQEIRAELADARRAWFGPTRVFEERFTTEAPFKSEKKSKRKSE